MQWLWVHMGKWGGKSEGELLCLGEMSLMGGRLGAIWGKHVLFQQQCVPGAPEERGGQGVAGTEATVMGDGVAKVLS